MSAAIDTNVLLRILRADPSAPAQRAAATRLLRDAEASGAVLFVPLCVLLETEWVLRSRFGVDRVAIADTMLDLLRTQGLEIEHRPAVDEAVFFLQTGPGADFADCLFVAHTRRLGNVPFLTFDARAAKLPGARLLRA